MAAEDGTQMPDSAALDSAALDSAALDSDAGLRMLEGYLYWQAESARAQEEAERFADLLPWLTNGQREDLVRLYRDDRLETSRAFVDRVAGRAQQLRREYSARYQRLRVRALVAACAVSAAVVAADTLLRQAG